jgi:valyl-tRNA synthetase
MTARHVLYLCLDGGLRLISPFMPFISEELFQVFTCAKRFRIVSNVFELFQFASDCFTAQIVSQLKLFQISIPLEFL